MLLRSMLLLAGALIAVPWVAAERCPDANSDAERLACYERLLDALEGVTGAETEADATADRRRAQPQGDGPRAEPPTGTTADQPRAEPRAAVDPPSATERFGLTQRIRHPADADVTELEAAVEEVAVSAHRRRLVRLDNGQLWEETEARNTAMRPGDAVVIRRATFGSFRMFVVDQSRSTTVRRVDCEDAEANAVTRRKCAAMGL
jgi:hypothetical protein